MDQFSESTQAALDYDSTIIGALELSGKRCVLAVQQPERAGIRDTCWALGRVRLGSFRLGSIVCRPTQRV